jgi:hypothetical protein
VLFAVLCFGPEQAAKCTSSSLTQRYLNQLGKPRTQAEW